MAMQAPAIDLLSPAVSPFERTNNHVAITAVIKRTSVLSVFANIASAGGICGTSGTRSPGTTEVSGPRPRKGYRYVPDERNRSSENGNAKQIIAAAATVRCV